MIKNLTRYLIPGLFTQNVKDWEDINLDEVGLFIDFDTVCEKHGIEFYIKDWRWELSEDNLIDLELELEGDWEGYYGNLYITWYKSDYECTGFWFSGLKEDDDSDSIFKNWENK